MRSFLFFALCSMAACSTAPVDDSTGASGSSNLDADEALDEDASYDVRVTYVQFNVTRADGYDYDALGNPPDPYVCFGERACTVPCSDTFGCIPANDGRLMTVDSTNWNDDTRAYNATLISGRDLKNGLALRTMDSDEIFSDEVDSMWAQFTTTAPHETFLQVGPSSLINYTITSVR